MNVPAQCVCVCVCVRGYICGYTLYTLEIRVIYWPDWWPCPALVSQEEDPKGIDLGLEKEREKRYVILISSSTFKTSGMSSLPRI